MVVNRKLNSYKTCFPVLSKRDSEGFGFLSFALATIPVLYLVPVYLLFKCAADGGGSVASICMHLQEIFSFLVEL